ncbi:5-oxoprolinase-like isoform X3 [Hydra vulgaris]
MSKFRFSIDRGGTFTDVYAEYGEKIIVMKLLSEDPAYPDAPTEAIRRILSENSSKTIPVDGSVPTDDIEWIRMGTTVATNALLERNGERMALVITKGFKDLLFIGNQARPNIFDLKIVTPDVLYEDVVEVSERLVIHQVDCQINGNHPLLYNVDKSQIVEEWVKVDEEDLRKNLQILLDKGIRCLAVVLMHSHINSNHEKEVGKIAQQMGFTHISLSSEVMAMEKIVPRGFTACADAYLTPHIKKYVESFSKGFQDHLKDVPVLFMQSNGGLTPVDQFIGSRAILSGPAGGVVGYALTTYNEQTRQPVIGFDMGGTSTDVSRYAGSFEVILENETAGVSIQAPQLDINTVAAGGGSRLFFRCGRYDVGPESARAHPGPVCYRKNGYLAVTDANLVLGRILPEFFPHIFGPGQNEPLDREGAYRAFQELSKEINAFDPSHNKSVEEIAMGFITIAVEAMCKPIRILTEARGYDTSKHVLASFGGAGGQHACAIAKALGMSTIFIHKYSGLLSAYGIALANVSCEKQESTAYIYEKANFRAIEERIEALCKLCENDLVAHGFSKESLVFEPQLNMKYVGTSVAILVSTADLQVIYILASTADLQDSGICDFKYGDFEAAFLKRYKREFGFTIDAKSIILDDIIVKGTAKSEVPQAQEIARADSPPKIEKIASCYLDNMFIDTKVYLLNNLTYGHKVEGPAIIIDKNCTILVESDCLASITKYGDIEIKVSNGKNNKVVGTTLDRIQLSIFSHRFMSTAEQMGRVLQRTSLSTNIKERLDFSCAMFGSDGGLVANAPHIPVHLGAMQETIKYQIKMLGDKLIEGDVLLSNHPSAGGTHLPDLTVITPVFYSGVKKPVFFVASRGHHADIGGTTPGSMPPNSKTIFEEGAVFKSFKIVENGVFQEESLKEALFAPKQYPGCSGTRNLKDNISDLKAQIAANNKGILLIKNLIDEYGLDVVQAYMSYIQKNAEDVVREMLKDIASATKLKTGKTILESCDYMDDGSPINLIVSINEEQGSAKFDFTGTGPQVYGNCNAPRAVAYSALIYCIRCMIGKDIPLNQGCLAPIDVVIPEGCLINPHSDAAVVGGNVLTSQRLVDVIFKAFETCAASQGCMNNVTFGDGNSGYYETVAGGAGAGPSWHGRSGIHTHMTNTRITDPEVLEKRYPVVLKSFSVRLGSGGRGKFNGGNGIVRELLFRREQTLSVLTERRALHPYGLKGGEPGSKGLNLLILADGYVINLGAKTSVPVKAGDLYRMLTPGGGGFGFPSDSISETQEKKKMRYDELSFGSLNRYKMIQDSA